MATGRSPRVVVARCVVILGLVSQVGCSEPPRAKAPEAVGGFLSGAELPPAPAGKDVTLHLEQFRFAGQAKVRRMTKRLEGRVRRPWTVERLAAYSASALDPDRQAAAVFVLAASRDSMALRVVGNALESPDLGVRITAAEGIVFFWIGAFHGAENAETLLTSASNWWEHRKAKIEAGRR